MSLIKICLKNYNERWFSPIDRSLRRELKSQNFNYWFDTAGYKNLINLKLKHKDGYFHFFIPRERLTSTSVRLFATLDNSTCYSCNLYCYIIFKKPNKTHN